MKIKPGILDFYRAIPPPYPTSGLVLELKFEDNKTDTSGSGISLTGDPASYTTGKVNKAAVFNGSSTSLTTTSNIIKNTDFTISAWIYPQSTFQPNVFNAYESVNGSLMYFGPYASSHWYLYYYINGQAAKTITWYDDTGIENEWHHMVITLDMDGSTKMFIDNSEKGNFDTGLDPTFTSIGLGKHLETTTYFKGYIDQFRVYNRVLTSGEIGTLYNSGNGI